MRVWQAPVPAAKVSPFQAFMQGTLFPALEEHDACLGMTTAVDRSRSPPHVIAVSVWTSMEGLESFTGPDTEGVIFDEAEGYLAGEPTVEHHPVLDHASY